MASKVGIANSALIKLGAARIIALTDDNKNAKLCNEQYDKMRLDLLRSHNWNFSVTRIKMAQLATAPTFEWDHAYQLPADWLRTVSVHGDDAGVSNIRYRVERGNILADHDDVWLRYVADITDVGLFDASFAECLAWRLALDLAISITQSNPTFERMGVGLKDAVRAAKATDAIEDYPEQPPESAWITARGGGDDWTGF